jgi:sugar lactone lactonase YvrE
MSESMYRNGTLERSITSWMADEVTATETRPDAPVIDHILTATGRLRPEPRWLALLKEPPMRVNTLVAVGTPSRRPLLIVALIVLLALAAGAVVVGANYLRTINRPTSAILWRTTAPGDSFGAPANLASDAKGNIWAPNTEHGKFSIFSPTGTYLESWGQPGIGKGFFNLKRPSNGDGYGQIAFQPDGSFYVLDVGNFRVQQFSANRTFVRTWGTPGTGPLELTGPTGLAIGADGSVYVLDEVRKVVEHTTRDGALIADVAVLQDHPGSAEFATNGLAVDRTGNLYISRGDLPYKVQKYDPTGRHLVDFGLKAPGRLGDQANTIVFDGHDHVYVTAGPHGPNDFAVNVYNPDGTFLTGFGKTGTGDGQFTFPTGMLLDGQGNLYVEDPWVGGGSVTKFELGPPLYP